MMRLPFGFEIKRDRDGHGGPCVPTPVVRVEINRRDVLTVLAVGCVIGALGLAIYLRARKG